MPQINKTLQSIFGRQTTAGAAEETLLLSLNGAAAAATIAVPLNTTLIVTDFVVTSGAAAIFQLQQANDGVTFFNVLEINQPAAGTGGVTELRTPLQVNGGALVVIRLRVTTPGGAALVSSTVRNYGESN